MTENKSLSSPDKKPSPISRRDFLRLSGLAAAGAVVAAALETRAQSTPYVEINRVGHQGPLGVVENSIRLRGIRWAISSRRKRSELCFGGFQLEGQ